VSVDGSKQPAGGRAWRITLLRHGEAAPEGATLSPLADCHHGRHRRAIAAVPLTEEGQADG
jgi:hypothetical protein